MMPTFTEIPLGSSEATSDELPAVELWIDRGLVNNRRREMPGSVFLIGSAEDCELVLELPDMPRVHSYLIRGEEGVAIRQLGQGYPLRINGNEKQVALLHDGDEIEVGAFRFFVAIESELPGFGQGESNEPTSRLGQHVVRNLVRHIRTIANAPIPRLQLYYGDEIRSRSA